MNKINPSNYCSIDPIKHFIQGTAASAVTLGLSLSVATIATYLKFIPDDPCNIWDEFYKVMGLGLPKYETFAIFSFSAVIVAGIGEELFFRGAVQDLVLKRLLGKTGTTAKVSRIAVASLLFGAFHLVTPHDKIPSAIALQAVCAVLLGTILGAVKESPLGLMGSIGCHMMHNAAAMAHIYAHCI